MPTITTTIGGVTITDGVIAATSHTLTTDLPRTSTNDETGSKTIAVGFLSSDATATQTFTRTRAEIYKGAAI